MSPEAQRIAIAEACGWTKSTETHPDIPQIWIHPRSRESYSYLPDYLTDLNAMHLADKVLLKRGDDWGVYCDRLMDLKVKSGGYQNAETYVHAAAAQRAEAFLRTTGEWDDSK